MGRQDYLWLHATGPCHHKVSVHTSGLVAANGSGSGEPEPFTTVDDYSQGYLYTNSSIDGTGSFTVGLDEPCDLDACTPLATVQVTVSGDVPRPSGAEPTARPTP
jgi:hypothetical protein